MARHQARAAQQHASTTTNAQSFGKPLPVVCDESAWFEPQRQGKAAAEHYIRERFQNLLDQDEIERLANNDVMLKIVTEHQKLFLDRSVLAEAA